MSLKRRASDYVTGIGRTKVAKLVIVLAILVLAMILYRVFAC